MKVPALFLSVLSLVVFVFLRHTNHCLDFPSKKVTPSVLLLILKIEKNHSYILFLPQQLMNSSLLSFPPHIIKKKNTPNSCKDNPEL